MNRISRPQMFLAMARAAAMRATCYRLNVGAVVVEDNNVIAVGYNGAPSGEPHCTGNDCQYFTAAGCKVVHAERNALERAARLSQTPRTCELYCTHSPCGECADLIATNGGSIGRPLSWPMVSEVYYETAYRDPSPVRRLLEAEIEVYRVLPSGLMVDERTGALCER